ncbi:isochorismatase family protein [uncultured Streptococcus sp.]|uniref:isochorismatase family protein n=1 Tax=uncultured Streptococcus sp. TaxID=83427 RepID=UPI0028EC5363|nr:isochorismatase family protein [uncultured Streptococcus sp.]
MDTKGDTIPELSDYIIIKASPKVFQSQDLNNILTKHQVDEVIITGFNAEYCCLFIAVVAIDRGYKVTYIEDPTASVNNGDTYKMPVLDIVDFVEYILDWSGQVEVLYFEEFKNRN